MYVQRKGSIIDGIYGVSGVNGFLKKLKYTNFPWRSSDFDTHEEMGIFS